MFSESCEHKLIRTAGHNYHFQLPQAGLQVYEYSQQVPSELSPDPHELVESNAPAF
jgi:hypothetical protein